MARFVQGSATTLDIGTFTSYDFGDLALNKDVEDGYCVWIFLSTDGNRTITDPGTFTTLRSATSGGNTLSVLYDYNITASGYTLPEVTWNGAGSTVATVFYTEGHVDPASKTNTNTEGSSSQRVEWPDLVTTSSSSLLLAFGTMDQDTIRPCPATVELASEFISNSVSQTCGWLYSPAPFSITNVEGMASRADTAQTYCFELPDDASGKQPPVYFEDFPFETYDRSLELRTSGYIDAIADAIETAGVDLRGVTAPSYTFDCNTGPQDVGTTAITSGSGTFSQNTSAKTGGINDSGASWVVNEHAGRTVFSSGKNYRFYIRSNTATTLSLIGYDGSNVSTYEIRPAAIIDLGTPFDTAYDGHVFRLKANGSTLPTGLTDNEYYHLAAIPSQPNYVSLTFKSAGRFWFAGTGLGGDVQISAVGSGTASLEYVGVETCNEQTGPISSQESFVIGPLYGNGSQFTTFQDYSTKPFFSIQDCDSDHIGAYTIFISDNGGVRAFKNRGRGGPTDFVSVIDVTDASNATFDEGSFDASSVEYVLLIPECENRFNSGDHTPRGYGRLNVASIFGGSVATPATWDDLSTLFGSIHPSLGGGENGQYQIGLPCRFGGSKTYDLNMTDENASVLFPEQADGTNTFIYYYPDFKTSFNSSSVSLTNHQITSPDDYLFEVESTNDGAVDFDGSTFIRQDFIGDAGDTYSNCAFIQGASFASNGATITNCAWDATLRAAGAFDLTVESGIAEGSVRNNTNGIEISAAGAYDLSAFVFSNNTTDVNVTATTGTVTLTLADGQSVTTATAGATIVFSTPLITANVTNVVAGSRLQIYNVTTDTEIANEVVPGTSYSASYVNGTDYTSGDTIRVRLTCQSGTTACEWFEQNTVANLSGWTVVANQVDLTAYATLGIDGSLVTEYTLDGTNLQVDANDLDGGTTKKRLVAWYYYAGTLEDGIRNFFGGIELEDNANAKIVTSIIDLTVDNVSSVQLRMTDTDFRLYRDDGATWIEYPSTGGFGIDTDSGKVFITNAGDLWNVDVVNGTFDGGSAASIIKNVPRLIVRKEDV